MGYRRSKQDKRKIRKLYDKTKHSYGAGAFYDDRKQRFVKYSVCDTPGYKKLLRRYTNKRVRKTSNIQNGASYKRLFDYWWTII